MKRIVRVIIAIALMASLSACQHMDPTEVGVIFRRLPRFVGGGVSKHVIPPGDTAFVMPWDSVYRFDTKPHDVSWGPKGKSDTAQSDFVFSRASDGNEVALAFTARYKVSSDPEMLVRLVETTATTNADVRDIVIAVGRSDIRRYMNELHTSAFLDTDTRYKAVDNVKASMQRLLQPFGIEIVQVNLDDYRFERQLKDGSIDESYQARLTEMQQLTENTERERSRMETVKAQKDQEEKAAIAHKNQVEAEAAGYLKQARLRGQAYFEARTNEAKAIEAKGRAEAQGIVEQINALNGAGGEALLRLELARQLRQSQPKFIILSHSKGGGGLDLSKVDANQLLQQMGIVEGLKDEPVKVEDSRAALAPQPSKEPAASAQRTNNESKERR